MEYTSLPQFMTPATLERFWSKVDKSDGCWTWRGKIASNGYGRFATNGTSAAAHRIAYATVREIPQDLVIDHLCRNRACCNPEHLEPVTCKVNVQRGDRMLHTKTQIQIGAACDAGHVIEDESQIFRAKKSGKDARCRACYNEYMRNYMREYSRARRALAG